VSKGMFEDFAPNEEELKIMRGEPAADTGQPADQPAEDEFEDKNGDDADRPRDDKGRFAPKAAEPEQKAAPAAEEGAEEEEAEADDSFKAFLAKHKDKKPEDILRLAFQQDAARRERATEAKRHREEAETHSRTLQTLLQRIEQARQAKAQEVAQRRQSFDDELKADPDAATRKLHEEMLRREQQELEARQWNDFVETQRRAFDETIRKETGKGMQDIREDLFRYAVEDGGYTPEEVSRASDARDLITLDRARRFMGLVKAGVINMNGEINPNYRAQPAPQQPATQQQPQSLQARGQEALARSARMAQQAPRTLSDARGGNPNAQKSLRARAEEILNLDMKDFGKLVESGELNSILRDLDR
jgi:hypothetical protein